MPLDHPFTRPPALGQTIPVAEGVLWLRMPLPFALNHINLWLIEDGDGYALIDTGIGDERTKALWLSLFDNELQGRPITRLIATHFHPDHLGLSGWLQGRFGVALEVTLAEWLTGRMLSLDGGQSMLDVSLRFYRAAGCDDAFLAEVQKRGNSYSKIVGPIPASFRRLSENDVLTIGGRHWRVLIGRGHSPEMACLYCEELGLFISGDQVLPSITPNISVWPSEPDADPLSIFLDTMKKIAVLPDESLVLPSHGLPFHGLRQRIEWIAAHHEERLSLTLDAAKDAISARELVSVLFPRELDNHQIYFALGESLAHLRHLCCQKRMSDEIDASGVHRFRRL